MPLLLLRGSGPQGAPPAPANAGFTSLVGRHVGGMGARVASSGPAGAISVWGRYLGGFGVPFTPSPTPPVTKVVGWPDTLKRRILRKRLEELLALQKNATFGRKWFEEFEAAEQKFTAAESKAAVEVAAKEAREAAALIHERVREEEFKEHLRQVALTLEVVRETKRNKDVISAAVHATAMARALKAHIEFEEDEDDTITLLLQ